MKKTEYRIAKQFVKSGDEKIAKENAARKLGVDQSQLVAQHTEKMFVFHVAGQQQPTEEKAPLFTVEKTESYTLADAIAKAAENFETFEGNIAIHQEDETHIVLKKVR